MVGPVIKTNDPGRVHGYRLTGHYAIRQLSRWVIGKWVSDNYRRRPMIIPVVVEV